MGFLGLFRLKLFHPEVFEQQLTQLTQAISQNREQIAALTSKKKLYRRQLSLYCGVIYLAYVAFRYKTCLDNLGVLANTRSRISVLILGQLRRDLAVMVLLPVVIFALVYMVNMMFLVVIRRKNKTLLTLLKKHKDKLEELKQVTNFSRTNQILQKFDAPSNTPIEARTTKNGPATKAGNGNKFGNKSLKTATNSHVPEKRRLPATVNIPNRPVSLLNEQRSAGQNVLPSDYNPRPTVGSKSSQNAQKGQNSIPAPSKLSFQDRLLDFIIGSEHNENVESRYALICANCYTHNGLAPPGCKNPNGVTYICRQCGFINGELNALQKKLESEKSGAVDNGEESLEKEVGELTKEAEKGGLQKETNELKQRPPGERKGKR